MFLYMNRINNHSTNILIHNMEATNDSLQLPIFAYHYLYFCRINRFSIQVLIIYQYEHFKNMLKKIYIYKAKRKVRKIKRKLLILVWWK